ncbi:response regulator [Myxosarcina sp. GI1(2024)]
MLAPESLQVLIVDDRITVQEILKSHLETESSLEILDCARNGQQALKIVEIHRPQIILMDIEMPVLDGLTATKIISERFVDCNVIIISVHDEEKELFKYCFASRC